MKSDDVPQDPGACYAGTLRRLTYAVGEDGDYEGVPSVGWEAEIEATRVATERAIARIRGAWEAARGGRTSPLGYHMVAAQMDLGLLSNETGLWRWRIKRHLRALPQDPVLLERYADALGIRVEALQELPEEPELL